MTEIFGFSLPLLTLVLLCGLFLVFCYQMYFYCRYINGIIRYRNKIRKGKVTFLDEKPGVSIIICSKNEADKLKEFLPAILEQDYPNFEVIVVNDGSTDETDMLLIDLLKKYPRLRTTFVPMEATNLSTKKLGISLGIKAAKNDFLLFTDADCQPKSQDWISLMVRNFVPKVEFVLGYGAYFHRKGLLNRLINYDTFFIALQYMGMAVAGKPYMGVGRNLAYRKTTFLHHNGFSESLGLISGDDDLFVNKTATKNNTRVEISPESITFSEPKTTWKSWYSQKARHLSVSPSYTWQSKLILFMEPFTRGLFYLICLVLLLQGNWLLSLTVVAIFLIRYLTQLFIVNRTAKHFKERRFVLLLLIFDIFLPFITLSIFITGNASRKKNKKW